MAEETQEELLVEPDDVKYKYTVRSLENMKQLLNILPIYQTLERTRLTLFATHVRGYTLSR